VGVCVCVRVDVDVGEVRARVYRERHESRRSSDCNYVTYVKEEWTHTSSRHPRVVGVDRVATRVRRFTGRRGRRTCCDGNLGTGSLDLRRRLRVQGSQGERSYDHPGVRRRMNSDPHGGACGSRRHHKQERIVNQCCLLNHLPPQAVPRYVEFYE
jgi:hypothetical protein